MNDKKRFSQRVSQFLAGRGFYIVLFVCTAVIGISAWVMFFPAGSLKDSGTYMDYSDTAAAPPTPDVEVFSPATPNTKIISTPKPLPTIAPKPSPTPAPAVAEPEPESAAVSATINDLVFTVPISGDISMEFAIETLIYSRTMGDWRTHGGVDIAGALGTKVLAVCDGTVTDIYDDDLLGTTVILDHGFNLSSVYSNLAAQPAVAVGDKVSLGSVIGSVGSTALGESGEVTHLHFEMRLAGASVDPAQYVRF